LKNIKIKIKKKMSPLKKKMSPLKKKMSPLKKKMSSLLVKMSAQNLFVKNAKIYKTKKSLIEHEKKCKCIGNII
jgi:hypothetical protein